MKLNNNKLTLAICLALGLSACTPDKTAQEYISSAKTNIGENKLSDAAIELKNAIKKDLKNAEARYLLGMIYLQDGQAAAAEKELMRSLELGQDMNMVLPALLRSLNLQQKHDETLDIIAQAEGVSVENIPTLKLYSAIANMRLGNEEQAQLDVAEANDISTESAFSILGQALLEAEKQNINTSLELVDEVIRLSPDLIEAYLLKGQLYSAQGENEAALEAYNQYFSLAPKDLMIRLFLANTYIKDKQFEQANEHIDFVLNIYPEHAFSNQLKAVVYFEELNWEKAFFHAEKAIQNGLNTAPNRLIAGLSAFKMEKYEVAHANLIMLQDRLPKGHSAHRVLGVIQMRLGFHEKAEATFNSLESISEDDANLLVDASFEMLKVGNQEGAKALLDKAEGLQFDDAEDITKVGVLKLSLNDLEGITDLQKALDLDPGLASTNLALGLAYLEKGDYESALKLAKKLQADADAELQVFGYNLEAKAYIVQENIEEANGVIDESLVAHPDNIYALNFKAAYYIDKKEALEAEKKINKVLNIDPDNALALKLYYALQSNFSEIDSEAVKDKIEAAYNKNPSSASHQELYVKVLFSEASYKKIITTFNHKTDNTLLTKILVGSSLILTQQAEEASYYYDAWLKESPKNTIALVGMILSQDILRNYSEALVYARRLTEGASYKDKAYNKLFYYLVINKKLDEAEKLYEKLDISIKNDALTKGIYGELLVNLNDYKEAITYLQPAYDELGTSRLARLIYRSRYELKQKNIGLEFLYDHINSHPNDVSILMLLANELIIQDKDTAKDIYVKVLAITPDNALALNNLAWIEVELKNYQSANKYALLANKALPNNAQILDTLGLSELRLNNAEAAIQHFTQALKLAPDDVAIQKHLDEANNSL